MLELQGKKVAVIGLSKRTGVAAARMLAGAGARVIASDIKKEEELKEELALLEEYPVEYELGGHGQRSLQSDLIVVSPGVPLDLPFFREAAAREIPVISEIELAYQNTEARIIAITGTNGKTTTTALIGEILKRAAAGPVRVAGNIGTPLIQEAVGLGPEGWLVVEISSFQLETIREFRPRISLYLNFTPDHLDRHKTLEAYRSAKKRIFLNQQAGDYALINQDDPEVVSAVQGCPARVYPVSTHHEVGEGVYLSRGELILNLPEKGYDREPVIESSKLPIRGEHNQQNVAFAVLASVLAGAELEAVREGILNFTLEHHRLEVIIENNQGLTIIDDSKATNPDAAVKALESFSNPIVLIAGGQDRDADFSKLAGVIRDRVRGLILLGETREKLRERVIRAGFDQEQVYLVEEMGEAVRTAFQILKKGDCLLLSPACPSWDMYASYRDRGEHFQREVKRWLE